LVELCGSKYIIFDGLVNGTNNIFKASTTYCEKNHYMDNVSNSKMGTLIRKKYSHYYDNNIESKWTPIEPIIKDIKIGKF